jgi:hypothetical protein
VGIPNAAKNVFPPNCESNRDQAGRKSPQKELPNPEGSWDSFFGAIERTKIGSTCFGRAPGSQIDNEAGHTKQQKPHDEENPLWMGHIINLAYYEVFRRFPNL